MLGNMSYTSQHSNITFQKKKIKNRKKKTARHVVAQYFQMTLTLKRKCRIRCLVPQLSETIWNLPLCSFWPPKRWWALPDRLCFCTTWAWAQYSGPCYSWCECNCRKGHISLGQVRLPKPCMSWDPLTSQCSHPLEENKTRHEMQGTSFIIAGREIIAAIMYRVHSWVRALLRRL